ncbi:ABC transporter substrate-binding protein [Methylobacterium oryzae CBMB20]
MLKRGGKTWYFITADYAFGLALERDTKAVVEKNGGTVVGGVAYALPEPGLLVVPPPGPGLRRPV